MRKLIVLGLLAMVSLGVGAATKETGSTVLKDVQPAGTTDKKHKKQQYDLSFTSKDGKDYTCRTNAGTKVRATDIPVGSNVTYEVKGDKGKVKTSGGKKLDCTIVRVAGTAPGAR